jgi:hypothetical protein
MHMKLTGLTFARHVRAQLLAWAHGIMHFEYSLVATSTVSTLTLFSMTWRIALLQRAIPCFVGEFMSLMRSNHLTDTIVPACWREVDLHYPLRPLCCHGWDAHVVLVPKSFAWLVVGTFGLSPFMEYTMMPMSAEEQTVSQSIVSNKTALVAASDACVRMPWLALILCSAFTSSISVLTLGALRAFLMVLLHECGSALLFCRLSAKIPRATLY